MYFLLWLLSLALGLRDLSVQIFSGVIVVLWLHQRTTLKICLFKCSGVKYVSETYSKIF